MHHPTDNPSQPEATRASAAVTTAVLGLGVQRPTAQCVQRISSARTAVLDVRCLGCAPHHHPLTASSSCIILAPVCPALSLCVPAVCPAGKYSINGTASCTDCPKGSWQVSCWTAQTSSVAPAAAASLQPQQQSGCLCAPGKQCASLAPAAAAAAATAQAACMLRLCLNHAANTTQQLSAATQRSSLFLVDCIRLTAASVSQHTSPEGCKETATDSCRGGWLALYLRAAGVRVADTP